MNVIAISGRITSDLEVKARGDKKVLNFTLAVFRTKEIKDFLPVTAWGTLAERIYNNSAKGKTIGITGEMQSTNYQDKDGVKRVSYTIKANDVDFYQWKNENGED